MANAPGNHLPMGTDSPLATVPATSPPPPSRMTWEEFLEWHPESRLAEWVNGEAFAMPLPTINHQRLCGFLLCCLGYYAEEKALGQVLIAPVLMKLPNSGREPDVLFIAGASRARIEELFINGPADLAVE